MTTPTIDDSPVWDAVVTQTAGNISPLLRPSALPAAIVDVGVDQAKFDPYAFQVRYEGDGIVLYVQAGRLNPAPVPAGGSEEQVTVRGETGTLVRADVANPTAEMWLYWHEPGTLLDEANRPVDDWLYELRSEGLDSDALLRIAGSLRPYP